MRSRVGEAIQRVTVITMGLALAALLLAPRVAYAQCVVSVSCPYTPPKCLEYYWGNPRFSGSMNCTYSWVEPCLTVGICGVPTDSQLVRAAVLLADGQSEQQMIKFFGGRSMTWAKRPALLPAAQELDTWLATSRQRCEARKAELVN